MAKGQATFIGYARVSSRGQATNGISLATQRRRLNAYATAVGARLVGIETDVASGATPPAKRPGAAQALARVARGEATGLLVCSLDRLSRGVRDVLDLAESAQREGWRLASVGEHLDTATPHGRFALTLLAALSALERERLSARTKEAMVQIAREGRARSKRTPIGWRTADGETEVQRGDRRPLVEHPDEQRVLHRIQRLRRRGLGARRIARALNEAGLVHPRSGQPWDPRRVHELLATLARRTRDLAA